MSPTGRRRIDLGAIGLALVLGLGSGVLSGTWVIVQPIDLQPRPGML